MRAVVCKCLLLILAYTSCTHQPQIVPEKVTSPSLTVVFSERLENFKAQFIGNIFLVRKKLSEPEFYFVGEELKGRLIASLTTCIEKVRVIREGQVLPPGSLVIHFDLDPHHSGWRYPRVSTDFNFRLRDEEIPSWRPQLEFVLTVPLKIYQVGSERKLVEIASVEITGKWPFRIHSPWEKVGDYFEWTTSRLNTDRKRWEIALNKAQEEVCRKTLDFILKEMAGIKKAAFGHDEELIIKKGGKTKS